MLSFRKFFKKYISRIPQYFGTCGRNRRRIMKISGKIKKRRLSNLMKIRNKNYSKFVIKQETRLVERGFLGFSIVGYW